MIKCNIGDEVDCNANGNGSNLFTVPISQLVTVNALGETSRVSTIAPFLTALSTPVNGVLQPVCMWHVTGLRNNGGVLEECDGNCLQNTDVGSAGPINCLNSITVVGSQRASRVRTAMNIVAGGQVTSTNFDTNSQFVGSTVTICENDVVAEFSMSLLGVGQVNVPLTLGLHPRFADQRCLAAQPTQAPRICYNTTLGASVHGVFGDDDNLVCIEKFLVDSGSTSRFREFDSTLAIVPGDVVVEDATVTFGSALCPFTGSLATQLCATPTTRLCFQPDC